MISIGKQMSSFEYIFLLNSDYSVGDYRVGDRNFYHFLFRKHENVLASG